MFTEKEMQGERRKIAPWELPVTLSSHHKHCLKPICLSEINLSLSPGRIPPPKVSQLVHGIPLAVMIDLGVAI